MNVFEKFSQDFSGKKVLIFGLGLQGRGVGDALLFSQIGCQVTVTDLKSEAELAPSLKKLQGLPIKFVLGQHRQKDVLKSDIIIRNAAVPLSHPLLELAQKQGISLAMDTALFARYCSVPLIGITGTRGKTTTSCLIYELLKGAGKGEVILGGNAIKGATLPLLEKIKSPHTTAVLELSSWQLQAFDWEKISPQIAVITNVYEDHLNRYPDIRHYAQDKALIFKYQKKTDHLVLNKHNPFTKKFAQEASAQITWFEPRDLPAQWQLKIKGKHNQENAAAAYQVAKIKKLYPQWMQPIFETFRGLPYRLETIAEIGGVKIINDTTSTTPVAAVKALKTIKPPIILIAGGASKNLSFKELGRIIAQRVKYLILLEDSATNDLAQAIPKPQLIQGRFDDLGKAVLQAFSLAKEGDTILFSPACASFGMFQNEFDRGNQFNQIIKKIQNQPSEGKAKQ